MNKNEQQDRKMFTKEEKIEAVNLAKKYGFAIAAKLVGVSKQSIHNWQKNVEEPQKEPKIRTCGDSYKYAESYRRKIAENWKQTGSIKKTAKQYGVDRETVERCIRDFCPEERVDKVLPLLRESESDTAQSNEGAKESATVIVETLTAKIAELLETQNECFSKIAKSLNDVNYRLDRILEQLSGDVEIDEADDED